jgi:hypothetical protein
MQVGFIAQERGHSILSSETPCIVGCFPRETFPHVTFFIVKSTIHSRRKVASTVRSSAAAQARPMGHMVASGFDYLLKVRVKDMESCRSFPCDSVAPLPGVQQTHSYFVMEEVTATHAIVAPVTRVAASSFSTARRTAANARYSSLPRELAWVCRINERRRSVPCDVTTDNSSPPPHRLRSGNRTSACQAPDRRPAARSDRARHK